jgi:hypothetical protein
MLKYLLVSLATCVYGYNPGVTASLNTIAVEHHKQFIANFILKALNTVDIPDIPIDSSGVTGGVNNNTYELSMVNRT